MNRACFPQLFFLISFNFVVSCFFKHSHQVSDHSQHENEKFEFRVRNAFSIFQLFGWRNLRNVFNLLDILLIVLCFDNFFFKSLIYFADTNWTSKTLTSLNSCRALSDTATTTNLTRAVKLWAKPHRTCPPICHRPP